MKNPITIHREVFFNFIKGKKETIENMSKTTQYYLSYFDRFMATGKKASWNWAGFWGSNWFFYRKMYLYAVLMIWSNIFFAILCPKLETLIDPWSTAVGVLAVLIYPALWLMVMIYGNYWYLMFAIKNNKKGHTTSGTTRVLLVIGWVLIGRPFTVTAMVLWFVTVGNFIILSDKMLDRTPSKRTQTQVSYVPAKYPLPGGPRTKGVSTS